MTKYLTIIQMKVPLTITHIRHCFPSGSGMFMETVWTYPAACVQSREMEASSAAVTWPDGTTLRLMRAMVTWQVRLMDFKGD
jgi:hypothetical protein